MIDGKEVSIAISDGMITYKGENIDKKLYNVDDSGTLSIKDNILFKQNRNITIPSKLDGKTVTKIANNCFKDTNIEYVNIPSSITTIGSGAFSGCSDLKEIVMPCYFPDGGLSSDSFLNLDSLNKITLISSKNSNKMVDNRNMPWYKTKTVSGIELTIGDGVTEIGQASFADQESIKSVKMSETVKYVGVWAFSSATGLTGVEMKGVTTIDTMAFVNCVKLGESKAQIVIPSTVKTINGNVFGGCGAITIIFEGDRSKISIDSTWLGDNTSAIVKNK